MVCMGVVDVSNLMVSNYFDLFLHYQSAVILVSANNIPDYSCIDII